MRDLITQRLTELKADATHAEEELGQVRARAVYLEAMLHRLGGAQAVLEELLERPAPVVATPIALVGE